MTFRHLLVLLALAATALTPATAAADGPVGVRPLITETVQAGAAEPRSCLDRAPAGARGVVTRRVTVPGSGVVAARLVADGGDWDVALFDIRTGRLVAGSAAFGANELAEGFVGGGREVLVQACRRRGGGSRASLDVTATPVPQGTAENTPSLLKVIVGSQAERNRLTGMDVDVTEHAGHDYVEVVAYGERDRAKLRQAGFSFTTEVPDLVAADRLRASADRAARARSSRAVPSGRTTYRRLPEYEAELKQLAERHPNLVKPITLPFKTLEGRDVVGVEITDDVKASDGKPVFLQMGVHHAREWPSGEHAMEWAHELVNGFGKNDRVTSLVRRVRTIVVPVVNPDGFNVSREAPVDLVNDPQYEQLPDKELSETVQGSAQNLYLVDPFFNYKRRNCRVFPGQPTPPGSCALPQFRSSGVDPNRNYGGFWGGPGASAVPAYDTYRGTGPFSEPETQNVQRLVSSRHVTTLITNHTFSNLVLRPPGIRAQGPSPDEGIYKALGDRMASRNGYASQFSYELYDTTGGTEDWTYYATGGLGFTFEIGPDDVEQNCGGFHPAHECTAKQYEAGQNNGGGNRAAYFDAMENAADATKHATLTGSAPAGATLRLKKDFLTETSPVEPFQTDVADGAPSPQTDKIRFPDKLETSLEVPSDGQFTWSINPSTRPVVASNRYRTVSETPTRTVEFSKDKQTTPNPSGNYSEANYEDETFSITPQEAGFTTVVSVQGTGADDYDIELFRREGGQLVKVGDSGNLPSESETIVLEPAQAGEYVLRVYNYAAAGPYTGKAEVYGLGPEVVKAGTKEAWTLECLVGGRLLSTQKIVVDRGERLRVSEPCGANAAEVARSLTKRRKTPIACASSAGFRSVRTTPVSRGRRVRLAFARRVASPVRVDVFQVSRGRRVLGERRVASFPGRLRTFTWDGTGNDGKPISDGVFFVRYRVKGARTRTDFRRATLVRRKGRFRVRPTYYRPDSCGLLASAKLERPAFGGRTNRPLRVAFRVSRRADVTVTVRRGKRVVRTIRTRGRAARRTHRLRIAGRPVARRGLYRVTVSVRSGSRRASTRLASERL
jgi:hypothetical protein